MNVQINLQFYMRAITVFLIFLGGCSPKATSQPHAFDINDGGLLSSHPCGPPCFWNILPGTTTKNQVNEILKEMNILETCKSFDYTSESGMRGIKCSSFAVTLDNKLDIVSGVGFSPAISITVGEIIDKFGSPNSVLVSPLGLPESDPKTSMTLYYDALHMSIRLSEANANVYEIDPNTIVLSIGYNDEHSYLSIKRYYSDWLGYGTYEIWKP